MANYYLISQLPSLDEISENTPLPISEERFFELCNRLLCKRSREIIEKLTLSPPKSFESSGSDLIDKFNESERNLRFALCKARAKKMNKPFETKNGIIPSEYTKAASVATENENPLEAEKYLNRFRLDVLETLKPLDCFSEDYICYYALKLKLILRTRQFDTKVGEKAYENIYNSVLNEERSEAK